MIIDLAEPRSYEIPRLSEIPFLPKVVLTAVPKSGIHLAELMVRCLCPFPAFEEKWVSSRAGNSWSNENVPVRVIMNKLSLLRPGCYVMGHLEYSDDISEFLQNMGATVLFVIRDPRDVLISQAHHVLSEDDNLKHPDKAFFRSLEFEDVLMAALIGTPGYPGLLDRYINYLGWLDRALVIRYEDMVKNPKIAAEKFFYGVMNDVARYRLVDIEYHDDGVDEVINRIVGMMSIKDTPTYRKGIPGQWRNDLTGNVIAKFEEIDSRLNVMRSLGYGQKDFGKGY